MSRPSIYSLYTGHLDLEQIMNSKNTNIDDSACKIQHRVIIINGKVNITYGYEREMEDDLQTSDRRKKDNPSKYTI